MAKKGGRDWQPGQSGNPSGRPPVPADIKDARKFNKLEVERILDKFMGLTAGELIAKLRQKDTPMLERMVGKIMLKAARGGDHFRLDFLLNRLIGKVKDQVEHGVNRGLAELLEESWAIDANKAKEKEDGREG